MAGTAFSLQGKRALVTGASRGIGRALAEGLALAGAEVAIAARSTERLAETAGASRRRDGEPMRLPWMCLGSPIVATGSRKHGSVWVASTSS